jgi:hypothetical protein
MNPEKNLSVEKMLQYCTGIADEFDARLNRVRNYVTNHNLTSGTANETILRNFLAQLSSGRYRVGQGFICDPSAPDYVSKQCDILLYDYQNYPLVYSESGIDIIFPKSAKMVIEVKTNLNTNKLKNAIANIESAKELNYTINGVIFAFKSAKEGTLIKSLQTIAQSLNPHTAPIAILLLDKGLIIHRWPGTELGGTNTVFSVRKCKHNAVIAFLLLLYYDIQLQGVWGGASIVNMFQEMLEKQTTKFADDIPLGA